MATKLTPAQYNLLRSFRDKRDGAVITRDKRIGGALVRKGIARGCGSYFKGTAPAYCLTAKGRKIAREVQSEYP